MEHAFWVFMGGGLGAASRYGIGQISTRLAGEGWPWGTLGINVIGSLLMGIFVGWLALKGENNTTFWRLFIATGFLGGFTTFSAFSLDVFQLWQHHHPLSSGIYALSSILLALAGLGVGLWLGRQVF